jgi:4-amino-4-deoxy-L-arabinose transferase-like glycosyltransferase
MRPFRTATLGGAPDRRRDIFWFGAIWFVAAYAVVSLSMTKFHHYILPALPGLAICVGCFLDDLLRGRRWTLGTTIAVTGIPLLALVTFDLVAAQKSAQRFIWLFLTTTSTPRKDAPGHRSWSIAQRC